MNKYSSLGILSVCILVIAMLQNACNHRSSLGSYKGKPFEDSYYKKGAQHIPGKLQCEYFDLGGEGVAFHDSDSINSGSGKLNPADGTYLNEFRKGEAVDISYTKFREPEIDNNQFNLVVPDRDQLYVGWTNPDEWTKYTVNVESDGVYKIGLMYTSNRGGKISISINDIDKTGAIEIPTTFVAADSVAWRQWHHWNYIDSIGLIELIKGLQTITIHTVENGQMNYDYLYFEKVK